MRQKGASLVKDNVDKLIHDGPDVPVNYGKAKGSAKKICEKLEELRQTMLAERIEYEGKIEAFNETIAGVAHDLKTPIATIAGYAECIQDGIDDRDYPALITEKANVLSEQIVSIVESVRSGEKSQEKRCVEASTFFATVVKELQSVADSKKITLKIASTRRANIYIDRSKIGRVLQNLVSNAIKFTPEGGTIVLKFSVWGSYYYVRVIDCGCGIKEEDRKHVFDKFYRADKARSGNSSGLGLYMAKQFVEEHGGEIRFKTKENKGTTFVFYLPIVPDSDKKRLTEKFERVNQGAKILTVFLTGFLFPFIYRSIKFSETHCPSTLLAALASLPLFVFFWGIDLTSEIVYNKMTFLAD